MFGQKLNEFKFETFELGDGHSSNQQLSVRDMIFSMDFGVPHCYITTFKIIQKRI